ncbi:MAG: hypothetical protein IKC63_06480 [Clostridia bacterium]|nr:hypothetical protein [Clostridia bacterium]
MSKRMIAVFSIFFLCLSFFSCNSKALTFSAEELSITLTDEFVEVPTTRRGGAFESPEMFIRVVRESRSVVEEIAGQSDVSLETYTDLVLKSNRLDLPVTPEKTCLTYEYTAFDETVGRYYTYYVTVHKSRDAFWLVQFVTDKQDYSDLHDEIETYLESITFNET